jgi:hypothetical protein
MHCQNFSVACRYSRLTILVKHVKGVFVELLVAQLSGIEESRMKSYNEFRKARTVSIWIGDFKSSIELDDYMNMSRKFEEDFGFTLNERFMPEVTVESEAVPVEKLIDGFSWSEVYAPAVVELARNQGVQRATTMVVFLNFDYQPGRAMANPSAQLSFLGVVPFHLDDNP